MSEYTINHVMSGDIHSGIFNSIIEYFNLYAADGFTHIKSVEPLEKADIYHYHRPHMEKKLQPNSVCTVHHDLNDQEHWLARRFFIPRYQEAQAVVCLNNSQKNILLHEENINASKLHVIPHGYNTEVLFPSDKPTLGKFVIGFASKRYERRFKGEAYLSELIKRLDPKLIKFILVGEDRGITADKFRKIGFEVDVYERLPYKIFNSFYQNIHALLMCSNYEGGPANIPEALATNTPIFTSKIAMSLDYVKDKKNGLFLTMDPDVDAKNIIGIAQDSDDYKKMIACCETARKSVLSWGQVVTLYHDIYKKIINCD